MPQCVESAVQGLSEAEQRVAGIIERRADELLENLRKHVELPTGGGNIDALDETRELFGDRLVRLGATYEESPGKPKPAWLTGGKPAREIPPTGICRRLNGAESGRVIICGHLDTVHDPDGPFRELSIRPDGKTANGPGVVDMKGGLVIAVAALEALEEAGVPANWTFLMNSDEETGTYHSEHTLRAEAPGHDFGLAIEPALPGGELAIERMGSGQFMVEVHGKSAHVGRAFTEGVSAVTALAGVMVRIGEMADPGAGKLINIGPVRGGIAANVVPDRAAAWGNVRYPTVAIGDEVEGMLNELATGDGKLPRVVMHQSFNRPAKPLTPETEALGLRARGVAEALGQELPFASTGGVCDGNILQDAGLATIDTLGVRGGGLHTPDEWIELSSLVERCQLLAILVARLSGEGIGD